MGLDLFRGLGVRVWGFRALGIYELVYLGARWGLEFRGLGFRSWFISG